MQHLTTLLHARDLVRGRPGIDWMLDVTSNVVVATFGTQEDEYVAYLADSREVHDAGYGEPIAGLATLNLELPVFRHDLLLVARRPDRVAS